MSRTVSDRPVKLTICSTPEHLSVVRAATEKVCRAIGFDEKGTTQVILSVDEALTNVIRHAYGGREDQPIDIELAADREAPAGGVRIRIRDYGSFTGPVAARRPEPQALRPGGLGVYIMQECMDLVEYERADGGGTLLTMLKRLPPPDGGSDG